LGRVAALPWPQGHYTTLAGAHATAAPLRMVTSDIRHNTVLHTR